MISSEHRPKEHLPELNSYVDENGDVRPDDDNPDGFDAVGYTPYGAEHTRGEAVPDAVETPDDSELPEVLIDGEVDLYALLDAAKAFAQANIRAGLIKHKGDRLKSPGVVHQNRENFFRLGTVKYKLAMGYNALKETAIANGMDPEHFDHQFTLNRNRFYRYNTGKQGEVFRHKLKKAIDDLESGQA